MTNLLLKTKTELFKWLSERERERESSHNKCVIQAVHKYVLRQIFIDALIRFKIFFLII